MPKNATYLDFTIFEERILVDQVKKFPILYVSPRKKANMKRHFWRKVARKVTRKAEECKLCWSYISTYYRNNSSSLLKYLRKPARDMGVKFRLDESCQEKLIQTSEADFFKERILNDRSSYLDFKKIQIRRKKSNRTVLKPDLEVLPESGHVFPENHPSEDDLDLFFRSLAATVKSLPPQLRIKIKKKVFNVVCDYETKHINKAKKSFFYDTFSLSSHNSELTTVPSKDVF